MDAVTAKRANRWLAAVVAVAVLCAIAAALSGFGHRFEWWDYRTGFVILRWAVYIAAGAGVICLLAFIVSAARRRSTDALLGLAGAIVALALVLPAWNLQRIGGTVPRIHDITTDTDNPPPFVAIAPLRKGAPNPATYAGAEAAAAQKTAYPDIRPLDLAVPPTQAFERALHAARDMGWEIVAAQPAEGRIEATATTFWFRFRDDVVVRVAARDSGSRIDVRSKSRVGRNDFGTNAKRIRAYLDKVKAAA